MQNRREFLKNTGLVTGLMLLPSSELFAQNISDKTKKITILHTNDQHSRIEPFEISTNTQTSNKGGFARRATLVQKIRTQESNVVLLDAGDIFQGTPYFNFFGGELEFKLMSMMQYDAATMGNHDFDNGLEGFKKQLPHAQFDFVCSNYDFSNTILNGLTKRYKVIVKDGIRIGIFGVGIEPKGLISEHLYKETKYLDPIEISQEMTQKLRGEEKCDLVICLSHLGYEYKDEPTKISDVQFAQKTSDIDLIIGGHTHTFLTEPQMLKNKLGKEVIVNQVGWAGLYLGRIDFYFEKGKKSNYVTYKLESGVIDEKLG